MSKGVQRLSTSAPLQENDSSPRRSSVSILLRWSRDRTLRSAFSVIAKGPQLALDADFGEMREARLMDGSKVIVVA